MRDAFMAVLSGMRLFGIWGTLLGMLLGAITGTLIFPLIGTVLATVWGLGIGLGLGTAVGILCTMVTYPLGEDELAALRGRLVRWIGVLTGLAAVVLMMLTTQHTLWDRIPYTTYNPAIDDYQTFHDPFISPYLFPVLVATLFWAGLAAAYTTHRFIDSERRRALGLPHMESAGNPALLLVERWTVKWWAEQFLRRGWWLILLIALTGALTIRGKAGLLWATQQMDLLSSGLFSLGYALLQISTLGLSCGLLVVFINRRRFSERLDADAPPREQRRLARIIGLYTAVTGVMMTIGILAPMQGYLMWEIWSLTALAAGVGLSGLAGLLAARLARRYGIWLMEAQERALALAKRQKRKPKRKHDDHAVYNSDQEKTKLPHPLTARGQSALLDDLFNGAHLTETINSSDRK